MLTLEPIRMFIAGRRRVYKGSPRDSSHGAVREQPQLTGREFLCAESQQKHGCASARATAWPQCLRTFLGAVYADNSSHSHFFSQILPLLSRCNTIPRPLLLRYSDLERSLADTASCRTTLLARNVRVEQIVQAS